MNYFVYSLNHHRTPLSLRERLYLDGERINEFYEFLSREGEEMEGMVLFTCNRTELILHHPTWGSPGDPLPFSERVISTICSLPQEEFRFYAQTFWGAEAVRHCFRVASGLDSMVLGEPQILGQWKEAFHMGEEKGGVKTYLQRLGERTLQIAKRVRSETRIGEYALTIPSLVITLAGEVFSQLKDKKVYVIGAGEMGDLTLSYLRARGASQLFVLSRTYANARALASEYGAVALPFSSWNQAFSDGDLIVISLAAYERIFTYADIAPIFRSKTIHPRLVFDLSVPRVVDPEVKKIPDLFFYTIDDLKELSERNLKLRREEIAHAEELITHAVHRFCQWYGDQSLAPLLAKINHILEEIRKEELERTWRNLGKRTPEEALEILSNAIIRKLMGRMARFARMSRDEAFLIQLLDVLQHPSEMVEDLEDGKPHAS